MSNIYKVFDGNKEINRIVASEDFVYGYEQATGYRLVYESTVPEPEPTPEQPDITDFLQGLYAGYYDSLVEEVAPNDSV